MARPPTRWVRGLVLVAVAAALAPVGGRTAAGGATRPAPAANWLVYHHDPAGRGVAGAVNLSGIHQVWTSPVLDGQLYGEPLVVGSTVIVATENDTVYALNAQTGRVRWSTHVGTPVDAGTLPCGDISPTVGITSTPVIDLSRHEVFTVADERGTNGPVHQLVGLTLGSGAVELRESVDPPAGDPAATLQRAALTLDGGRVVFGYGGNYGDCGNYHGWIVSVPESGGALLTYELDPAPGQREGAVWMGGAAPEVDAQSNLWVAVGNGSAESPTGPYDGSDSVIELSPTLQLLQSFAPRDWAYDNAHDRDLGSSTPALLNDGLVFQAGKSDTAYLLSQSKLGGVGGQLTSLGSFCGNDVDGGNAVLGSVVYVPCSAGVQAVAVGANPPSLRVLWRAPGAGGPPILAGGFIWTIGQDGSLDGLNRSTGAVEARLSVGGVANHFPTPSAGDGRLFAPGEDQVFAFAGRSPIHRRHTSTTE